MLDDLYQADIDAAIADMVARPQARPQTTKFSGWKATTAIPRGAAAGAMETGAMVPDVAEAVGNAFTSIATDFLPDPRAPGGAEFKAREQQRAQGASSAEGDYLRQQTKQFMPDPHSAHLAEQTVFGLSRFATKAVGSAVVAGPAGGAVALGVNEGLTTADDLKAQGVDLNTRTKIGAVAGAVSAVGVALPMAGKTVGATVGLWAAGGPASFIGQQAATKQILQSAGYDKLSDQIDPLDPVGLAVSSVVPAGFAAWGLRRQAAVKALKTEADVKAAAALTPDEQARSDAFETSDANLDLLRKDITQAKTPAAKAALQENLDGLLKLRAKQEASGAPTLEQIDAARVEMLTQHMEQSGLYRGDDAKAAAMHVEAFSRAMQDLSAGRRVTVTDLLPPEQINAALALDTFSTRLTEARAELMTQAAMRAEPGAVRQIQSELVDANARLSELEDPATIKARAKDLQQSDRLSFKQAMTQARGEFEAQAQDVRARVARLEGMLEDNATGQQAFDALNRLDKQDQDVATQRAQIDAPPLRETPTAKAAKEAAATTPKDSANVQDAPKPAAGQPAEAPAQAKPQAADAPGAGPAGAREQGSGSSAGSAGAAAEAGLVAQRLAEIQQQFPDLTVQMDGMDAPVRLADFLADVQREAMEGTDFELGGNDASLMQVAASCFLLNG